MDSVPLYPLRFDPIFKPAIWGGRRLADMFPGAPAEGPIGEAWVLSDHGNDVSVVADGALKGATLRELMAYDRKTLLGPSVGRHKAFPLLLKYIDARESLSVQVHPDDALARKLAYMSRGKTEAWVVLHAEPGSRVYAGLKAGVGRAELEAAVAAGSVADCLHSFEPVVGDCIYLPASTVHALGAGITVFEIQQASDTTYRLFDWNRVDPTTGRARELHVDHALACADYQRGPVWPVEPIEARGIGQTRCLLTCPYFVILHTTLNETAELKLLPDCRILVPMSGIAKPPDGLPDTNLRKHDVALVHARGRVTLNPQGTISFLEIRPK